MAVFASNGYFKPIRQFQVAPAQPGIGEWAVGFFEHL